LSGFDFSYISHSGTASMGRRSLQAFCVTPFRKNKTAKEFAETAKEKIIPPFQFH